MTTDSSKGCVFCNNKQQGSSLVGDVERDNSYGTVFLYYGMPVDAMLFFFFKRHEPNTVILQLHKLPIYYTNFISIYNYAKGQDRTHPEDHRYSAMAMLFYMECAHILR